ncbi:chymotrypsin-1-like [Aphidius gifuensis]|uniref:chymotrypsin-1-like n=1 Tax=Aphidius gifuensis TaxID=684658 RepID=UPI001CDB8439|nr:chymotrypsin-1-like [Aphidius gifuensis]
MRVSIVCLVLCISFVYGKPPSQIVGGKISSYNEFPHQVSIRVGKNHLCGGAILDKKHIITAAHCFVETDGRLENPEGITILAGVNNREDSSNGQEIKIESYSFHEEFTYTDGNKNDIAIVKLAQPLVFNSAVKPVNLPKADTPLDTVATVSGWGAIYHMGGKPSALPNGLNKVDVAIVSSDSCTKSLKRQIQPGQICAFIGVGRGTCVGDSGGPMIVGDEIIGIVSWGHPCAIGQPDVYTRVFHYLPWINRNFKINKNL